MPQDGPDWLSFSATPALVTQPAGSAQERPQLSQAAASRVIALPQGLSRWSVALAELEGTLSSWSLPPSLARRWLGAAKDVLSSDTPLELYVELDRVVNLVTIELWNDHGHRLYGLDDYLPAL